MGDESDGILTERLRRTRVKLLVAATVATMVAMLLPGAEAEDRVPRERVEPVYPKLAKQLGISGTVRLALTVDCAGSVIWVRTIRGERLLEDAAKEAAWRWRFTSGVGTATVNVDMDFNLCR